ncbi:hypothetical protein SDJN02_13391, partial [Cucurbita argyrosperma subsp. argyrosperma]
MESIERTLERERLPDRCDGERWKVDEARHRHRGGVVEAAQWSEEVSPESTASSVGRAALSINTWTDFRDGSRLGERENCRMIGTFTAATADYWSEIDHR